MDDEKLRDLYEAGYSLREIGARAYMSRTAVTNRLRAMGVVLRSRGTPVGGQRIPDPELITTVELYRRGLSMAEVGEQLGVSKGCVEQRLKSVGIPRRSKAESLSIAYQRGRRKPTGFKGKRVDE